MTHELDVRLSRLTARDLFVVTLYGEARGEPIEGQIAVAWVIQNRLKSGRWGRSLKDVLGAWAQFSALWPTLSGGLNYQDVLDTAGVVDREDELPGAQGRLLDQLCWVVDGVMCERPMDTTYGSLHYFATSMAKPPYWAVAPGVRMATIGRHEFWAGVK
jgi:hypothetical protein